MKLKYLGTGAAEGWPALFCECPACRRAEALEGKNIRTRSGALVDENLLIDFSPDIYAQKLRHKLNLGRLQSLIITHNHSDHYTPSMLEMFAPPFAIREKAKPLEVYISRPGRVQYHDMIAAHGLERLKDESYVRVNEIRAFEPFETAGFRIYPLEARHGAELPLIYVIEKDGRRILYGNDTGHFPDATWDYLKKHFAGAPMHMVSLDCTNGPNHSGYSGHMGFAENRAVREQMLEMKIAAEDCVFISNHFSHCAGSGITHEEMEEQLAPFKFKPSYDGMEIDV